MSPTQLITFYHCCPTDKPTHFWNFKKHLIPMQGKQIPIQSTDWFSDWLQCPVTKKCIWWAIFHLCGPASDILRRENQQKQGCENKAGSTLSNAGRFKKKWKGANTLYLNSLGSLTGQEMTLYTSKSTNICTNIYIFLFNSLEQSWYPWRKKNLMLEKQSPPLRN